MDQLRKQGVTLPNEHLEEWLNLVKLTFSTSKFEGEIEFYKENVIHYATDVSIITELKECIIRLAPEYEYVCKEYRIRRETDPTVNEKYGLKEPEEVTKITVTPRKCGKCGEHTKRQVAKQVRSGDEPITWFYFCICGHVFSI
jgi:DNA-directed RNA polymerase subunit M/transcription elongation factor TFIIS